MAGYLVRRIAQAVIVVLGVTAVTFILEHLIPGSLARAILGTRASSKDLQCTAPCPFPLAVMLGGS